MPSASSKQHRFMSAVAHNPTFAKKAGVPQSVGKDFAAADKGRKFGRSSRAGINIQNTQHGKMDMPFKSLRRYAGLKGGGEIMIPKKMSNRSRIRMPDMRSSMMPMRPTMPPKMAGGMRAGGKVKTFKRGGKAGKVAALAGILGLGALALRDKKTAPVEDRRGPSANTSTSAAQPTGSTFVGDLPTTADQDTTTFAREGESAANVPPRLANTFGESFKAARSAGLKTFPWRGKSYTTELAKPKEREEVYPVRNYDAMEKRDPGELYEFQGMKKGGIPMKDGKPAFMMKKKMMGGGMAKYAKGGGIESRGKTKGTVIRMASGGSVSSRADGIAQRGKTKFKTY